MWIYVGGLLNPGEEVGERGFRPEHDGITARFSSTILDLPG